MPTTAHQSLRALPSDYAIRRLTEQEALSSPWLALVRAPEGLTAVVEADAAEQERWTALYSGDEQHGLDVPGMLASLLAPLADAGVPVFVASTFNADLVLVPSDRIDDAAVALAAAGHTVS
ncbi:ACT domain-containing protein [Microbacterium sp. KUDC0406]|uniref:ACT domain-containing protein n=1 Tax=Microbacterium sp. KUDC0406 TaxID=2909588 RepID=UPI001F1B409E|nr:ACT domain-containing protein [Microbacterium sp. KUDC0406]UJP09640.1 ACT domain-containing protein [Microbacterium sp. KUDC0406]